MNSGLHQDMTLEQFENGYWYARDLKQFATKLGVQGAGRLRKDQLESEIKHYLKTGELLQPKRSVKKASQARDVDKGLRPDLRVNNYTSNRETKDFILSLCHEIDPHFKARSGTRYLLNRWREEQLESGLPITYRDLALAFLEINASQPGPLRTVQGRYNNFYSDFRAAHKDAKHSEIVAAWNELKTLDMPKTYRAWVENRPDPRS